MIVLDASAVLELLLRGPAGRAIALRIASEDALALATGIRRSNGCIPPERHLVPVRIDALSP